MKVVYNKDTKRFSKAPEEYLIYRVGGSIGENHRSIVGGKPATIEETGLTLDEAKEKVKRWNSSLNSMDKKYYGIRYGYRKMN